MHKMTCYHHLTLMSEFLFTSAKSSMFCFVLFTYMYMYPCILCSDGQNNYKPDWTFSLLIKYYFFQHKLYLFEIILINACTCTSVCALIIFRL